MKKAGKILFLILSFCMISNFLVGNSFLTGKSFSMENSVSMGNSFLIENPFSMENLFPMNAITAKAAGSQTHPSRLVDDADLLSQLEEQELLAVLDRVSEEQQCDVVIVTVWSLNGRYIVDYADDYFNYNGYGMGSERDGILFLISMDEREWAISTCGFGITAFTDAGQEYITDRLMSDLRDGEYYEAFSIFAEEADHFLEQARNGRPYDRGNLPGKLLGNIALAAVIGLIGGLILAILSVAHMKKEMQPVYAQPAAMNYLVRDSSRMWDQRERLIRKYVNKIHIPRNHSGGGGGGSSTHRGSSGMSHGGSHGRF